jgi:hypothetical protein
MPPNRPPWSNELYEFLATLHESEHAMLFGSALNRNNLTSEEKPLAQEIDADYAVINVLKDMNEPKMIDYWLASRNVGGLKELTTHNTSLYIRLHEAGIEMDVHEFYEQQAKLRGIIGQFVDLSNPRLTPGQMRGAVQYMNKIYDMEARLPETFTPEKEFQRSAFRQLEKDFETLGYKANPNFPSPRVEVPPAAGVSPQPVIITRP